MLFRSRGGLGEKIAGRFIKQSTTHKDGAPFDHAQQFLGHPVFAALKQPNDHVVLADVMSKEPLGPAVRHGDDQWLDIIKWVAFGLIQAEEFGVTSKNIGSFADNKDPNMRRFLGAEGGLGTMLGLSDDFMARAVRLVGNYGELFERHLQPLNLTRGVNALWTQGGLLYAPPFR